MPFFLAFTLNFTREQRRRTISVASFSAFMVIAVSAVAGLKIIEFFGISIASFQVGGGTHEPHRLLVPERVEQGNGTLELALGGRRTRGREANGSESFGSAARVLGGRGNDADEHRGGQGEDVAKRHGCILLFT